MLKRLAVLAALSTSLAGCVTADNPIPLEEVASYRLADVAVSFPADAQLNYLRAEEELAASKGVAKDDAPAVAALVATPEGASFIRRRATAKMQEAFRQTVAPVLRGTHPVRVEVAVKSIDVPGIARSMLVGIAATLVARVSLVDGASGRVLITLPDQSEVAPRMGGILGAAAQSIAETNNGVDEPYQRLCDALAKDYAEWLFKKRNNGSSS